MHLGALNSVFRQFSKFIVVGGISTALNYGTFLLCLDVWGLNYLAASAIGFMAGVLLGFVLNTLWTFQENANVGWKTSMLYFLVYGFSLGLSLFLLKILTEWTGYNPKLLNVFVIGVTTVTNFVGIKLAVFTESRC